MPTWTWIVVAALAGILAFCVLFIVLRRSIRRRAEAAEAALRADLDGAAILRIHNGANYFGRSSRGAGQLRGNGVLALTADGLHFRMWLGSNHLTVPRDRIRAADETASHLGKRVGQPLLRIAFTADDGAEDSAAWWIPRAELPEWIAALAPASP